MIAMPDAPPREKTDTLRKFHFKLSQSARWADRRHGSAATGGAVGIGWMFRKPPTRFATAWPPSRFATAWPPSRFATAWPWRPSFNIFKIRMGATVGAVASRQL